MPIWHHPPDLAALNALGQHTLSERLGIRFVAVGDDWLSASMPVDARTHQPFGLLHGGASAALAETVGSTAALLTLDTEHFLCVGLDLNINHLRAERTGSVTATARPLHVGRSTQVWDIRIEGAHDHLTAIARLTLAVVKRQSVVRP